MSGHRGNRLRFSKEEDDQLINIMSANPALYDSKHKLFHDHSARDRTWEEIANTIGKNVIDCKVRWKSLKDVYRKRKRESIDSSNKKSKWEHLDALKFLEDVVSTRGSSGNKKMKESDDMDKPEFVTVVSLDGSQNDTDIKIEMDDLEGESSVESVTAAETMANNPNNQAAAATVKSEDSRQNSESRQAMKMFFDSMAQTVMSFPTGLAVANEKDRPWREKSRDQLRLIVVMELDK